MFPVNQHEILSLIFSEKKKNSRLSSAAVVIGTLWITLLSLVYYSIKYDHFANDL